jgi:microcystin-dependent protein
VEALQQTPTTDAFPTQGQGCSLGPSNFATGLAIEVFNASIDLVLLYWRDAERPSEGISESVPFQFPTAGQIYPGCVGFRARSHTAGSPAAVLAQLYEKADGPLPGAPVPITQTITPTGQIVNPASVQSGTVVAFAGPAAPIGWVLCDGTHYNSVSDPTFANLFAAIGLLYGGSGSNDFAVPDLRGRVIVALGTNASVNGMGANDGVAVGSRRPQHRHTPHTHVTAAGGGTAFLVSDGSLGNGTAGTGDRRTTNISNIATSDGGSGVGSDAIDSPAFLVLNYIIAK